MTPRHEASQSADVPLDLPIAARIQAAVERFGESDTIDRAIALLAGANAGEEFLLYVGGEHAQGVLDGAPPLYWPELWGARALLYVWSDTAVPAVTAGLSNQSWRVREMCLRVAAARELEVADRVVELTEDESPRVRAAAMRALGTVGAADQADTFATGVRDADRDVRRAAQEARDAWRARHPRDSAAVVSESPAEVSDVEPNSEAARTTE